MHACTERNLLSYNYGSLPLIVAYSQENQKHKCHQTSCSCNSSNGTSAQPWNIGCCWFLSNWCGVWIGHHKWYVHTKLVGIQVSTTLLCGIQGQSCNSVTPEIWEWLLPVQRREQCFCPICTFDWPQPPWCRNWMPDHRLYPALQSPGPQQHWMNSVWHERSFHCRKVSRLIKLLAIAITGGPLTNHLLKTHSCYICEI